MEPRATGTRTWVPTPHHPIVAFILAGKTGSGKSSFIKLLGGKDLNTGQEPIVSGALDSCTTKPTVYTATIGSREVLLLDTPGFDDSAIGNLEILNEIMSNLYLFALRRREVDTQGVIFLHDIGETRFGGSQRKTLELLKAMVGRKAMKNVIIGTTMWSPDNTPKYNNEVKREREFMSKHWSGILKTTRLPEEDQGAALGVINDLLACPPCLLLAQEEILKPPHTCEATTVGKIAIPEGRREAERLKQEYEEELQRNREEAAARNEEHMKAQRELMEAMAEDRAKNEEETRKRNLEWAAREEENKKLHQEAMQKMEEENRRTFKEAEEKRIEEARLQREEDARLWREKEEEDTRIRNEEWTAREAENQRRHEEAMKNMGEENRRALQLLEDRRNEEARQQREDTEKMWTKMREAEEESQKRREKDWAVRDEANQKRHEETMKTIANENKLLLQQQEEQRINEANRQREDAEKKWTEMRDQHTQTIKLQQEESDKRFKEEAERRDTEAQRIAKEAKEINDRLIEALSEARQPPPEDSSWCSIV